MFQICFHVGGNKNNQGLTFLAIGDFGGISRPPYTTHMQRKVAEVMGQYADSGKAQFVIGLGDNFYGNGVKTVDDPRFTTTFEHVYTNPTLVSATWYMIAGNHDHDSNVSAQIAYTKVSRRWHYPDFFYSQVLQIPDTLKTVQLVMIDTTLLCCRNRWMDKMKLPSQKQQLKWLNNILRNSTADYLIVAGHHPVLSAGIHGNTKYLVSKLKPMLEENDVTVYLSGHDHNLQHLKEPDTTVHYFVSGNGNFYSERKGYDKAVQKSLLFFSGVSGGFTLLHATPESLQISQIDSNGRKLNTTKLKSRTKTVKGVKNIDFYPKCAPYLAILLVIVGTFGARSLISAIMPLKTRSRRCWNRTDSLRGKCLRLCDKKRPYLKEIVI